MARDLIDTLIAHKDGCVVMAARRTLLVPFIISRLVLAVIIIAVIAYVFAQS